MPTPLEQFTTMAVAIAEAAARSQLGQDLLVTNEPGDMNALELDSEASPQTVTGHFAVAMDGTPGSMTASLALSGDAGMFDIQLVITPKGSDEQVVFTATVEDSMGLTDSYRALLDAKRDPGADPDIQNTLA
ncbi:hypothetical protein ACFQX4_13840 [Roseomonas sp. GCM10028921]